MASDRIFGLVVLFTALAFIAGATQIQTSFISGPVWPKVFPIMVGAMTAFCALFLIFRPDPDPEWPGARTFGAIGLATAVLIAYAFLLKPLGYLLPTAIAAAVLSYQISPRAPQALMAGVGLSGGLFVIFKYALGLSLVPLPHALAG